MKKWTRKRLLLIAWLTAKLSICLPTNAFTGEMSPQKTDFLNTAMSLRFLSEKRQKKFNQADAAFFSMLRAMSPSGYIGFTVYDELPRIVTHIPSGGFLLIDGPYGRVLEYFRGRDFERLPFVWDGKHIYRRQVRASA